MPANADRSMIKPTPALSKSIYKVIFAITLFVITYLLLLVATIAIAAGMGWLGFVLITKQTNFIGILIGIGLILSGIMLIFFLLKFIFTKNVKRSKGYEITKNDQPELFEFIDKVANEVGTAQPRHVYLIQDVNASASFDPTFWSLFLPIKKDLNIGLGIVNGLNQSEFKAVLAHEFGHFSQRSMRFGSYVYHLNRALHNLLYENNSYHKALNAWGKWHYSLRFGAMLNVYIVRCIQEILKKVYILINKSHMQLSRQMEFHADTIAAYVSGTNNVVSLLRRLEITDQCYNDTLNLLHTNLADNNRVVNMYELQLVMLKLCADKNKLNIGKNGLPVIDKKVTALQNAQIILDDQWSSHPSVEDREENVNRYNLNVEALNEPAWQLFNNAEHLQGVFTDRLYENTGINNELKVINIETIRETLEKEINDNSYNRHYKGFYNGRFLKTFNVEETISATTHKTLMHFDELFSDNNCNLPKAIEVLSLDIAKLDSLIEIKNNDIKSFDYNGVKYYPKDAGHIKDLLNIELQEKENQLEYLDRNIFMTFYQAASTDDLKRELIDQYKKIFKYQEDASIDFDNYNNMLGAIQPTYTQMKYSDVYEVVNNIYRLEKTVKPRIKTIIQEVNTKPFIDEKQKKILHNYLNNDWIYFNEPRYDNNAINVFNTAANTYIEVISNRNFQLKKKLFDFQLTLNYPN